VEESSAISLDFVNTRRNVLLPQAFHTKFIPMLKASRKRKQQPFLRIGTTSLVEIAYSHTSYCMLVNKRQLCSTDSHHTMTNPSHKQQPPPLPSLCSTHTVASNFQKRSCVQEGECFLLDTVHAGRRGNGCLCCCWQLEMLEVWAMRFSLVSFDGRLATASARARARARTRVHTHTKTHTQVRAHSYTQE